MSGSELERLQPEERRASQALRELRDPAADAGFRARLKRDFMSGAPARQPVAPRFPGLRRPGFFWVAVPAAAAAVLIGLVMLNPGPQWEVLSARGEGAVVIDGVPVAIHYAADLERRLKPGARLVTPPEGVLEIMLPGLVAMQIAPGTDVVLPAAPGLWFAREANARLRVGEVRVTTGASFPGARLAVETPDAMVEVRGTTLAVICEPTGTCVCVLEGSVTVASKREGAGVPVTAGRRRYVWNDDRAPEVADIRGNEIGELREFMEQRRPLMNPR